MSAVISADPVSTEISDKHRIHPNSLNNLRLWQPGAPSPNPGGVKKGTVFVSECYKRLMSLPLADLERFVPSNAAEVAALKQVRATMDTPPLDALPSLKEITDRTEGKAPQRVDVTANVVNINVQVQLFIDGARDLASRYDVPVQLAAERMLALAPAGLRPSLEAALASLDDQDA